MKKYIIAIILLIFITPICIHANTPIFTSEAEIDAYYDNQKKEIREYYEGKIEDAYKQRDMELEENRKFLEDGTVEIYKKYFGDNLTWEMIGKYFPENNPNAEEIYWDALNYPTVDGISKLKMIYFVNTDLYEKLKVINKEQLAISTAKIEKVKEEVTKYNISNNTTPKKDEIIKNQTQIEDKIITNTDIITTNNEEVIKTEPKIKLRWYQKILKWFKK